MKTSFLSSKKASCKAALHIVPRNNNVIQKGTFFRGILVKGKWEEQGETLTANFNFVELSHLLNGTIVRKNSNKETGCFALNNINNNVLSDDNGILEFHDGTKLQGEFKITHFINNEGRAVYSNDFVQGNLILKNGQSIPLTKEIIGIHKYLKEEEKKSLSEKDLEVHEAIIDLFSRESLYYF